MARVRGDDPLKIMQRAGHSDFETTKIYLREAENLTRGFGEVFPPLPQALLQPSEPMAPHSGSDGPDLAHGNGARQDGLLPDRRSPKSW
jgi:hypothetical protein